MADKFELILDSYKDISPRVRHLCFTRADGQEMNFIAGQFISININVKEKTVLRNYSIANTPNNNNTIEIACAYVEGGLASELLFNLKVGEKILSSGPFGRFVLKEEDVDRYLLIATGTGVTPYLSMLKELENKISNNNNLEIILLMGGRSKQELLYTEDFLTFESKYKQFKYYACCSREMPEILEKNILSGYVQDAFPRLNLTDGKKNIAYLCGHPEMVDVCFATLQDQIGIARENIRREKYIFGVQVKT